MHLPIPRHRHAEAPVDPDGAPVIPAPRNGLHYSASETHGRTDLTCTTCSERIAFGVHPDRLASDAAFFLDAHAPFCRGGRPHP